jgi:hypothetical protein
MQISGGKYVISRRHKQETREILKVFLSVKPGEVHAIMGPNGSSKTPWLMSSGQTVNHCRRHHLQGPRCWPRAPRWAREGLFPGLPVPGGNSGVSNMEFLKGVGGCLAGGQPALSAVEFVKLAGLPAGWIWMRVFF